MAYTTYGLIFVNIFFFVFGQILWKIGLQKIPFTSFKSLGDILLSPHIWLGLLLYGIATIIWFKILSSAPLSLVYPLQAISYIVGMICAWLILGESITMTKWLGGLIILVGVYVLTLE